MNDPTRHSGSIPEPNRDATSDVDWWASRLVDGEIAFADVPADLRREVDGRVAVFATQRRTMLRSAADHHVDTRVVDAAVTAALDPHDAVVVPLRRRLVPFFAVAAASIVVIAFGASVLQRDDDTDVVALDASVEVVASSAVPAIGDEPVERTVASAPGDEESAAAMSLDSTVDSPDQGPASMPASVVDIANTDELADFTREWWTAPPPTADGEPICRDDLGRRPVAVRLTFAGVETEVYFSPEQGVMLLSMADCSKLASILP